MKRFVIFGAAEFETACYRPQPGDYILAADGGVEHVRRLGITPDGILGDFDSLGYVPTDAIVFPVEKDDTDSMLAVKRGLELGYTEFLLLGCLDGKRLDHTVANLQTLMYLVGHGARGTLVGKQYCVTAISRETLRFPAGCRGIVSVFCMGSPATGVNIRGLQYPLQDATLTAELPLGVSNHFTGEESEISVESGCLMVFWDRANGMPERIPREEHT